MFFHPCDTLVQTFTLNLTFIFLQHGPSGNQRPQSYRDPERLFEVYYHPAQSMEDASLPPRLPGLLHPG